jgi:hypothetical protein
MSFFDKRYINQLAFQLQGFSWTSSTTATCRCPICGDSKKDKHKKRFFFFQSKGEYLVKCHNCQYANSFKNFLKHHHVNLYQEYALENFRDGSFVPREVIMHDDMDKIRKAETRFVKDIDLPRITDLESAHPARAYLEARRIPQARLFELYYADDFRAYASTIVEGKFRKEPRIIIPLYTLEKQLFGVQGRAIGASDLRYITVRKSGVEYPKLYGLDRLDQRSRSYCFEGPIDSMFVKNGVAMAGASVPLTMMPFDWSNTVFVFDNQPRNREMLGQMAHMVNCDCKVCIWPDEIKSKDLNEMVLNGEAPDPEKLIDDNTYQGLKAKLQFGRWSKV